MNRRILDRDFFTIKKFAEMVGMTLHMLRIYDKTGLFHPAMRKNTYRYYSPTQLTIVKMIRILTEIGVPHRTIKELAYDRTPEKIMKLLSKNREMVADELRFLEEVYSIINTFIESIYEGIRITETEITVSVMPEKSIIMGETNDFNGEGFFKKYAQFCNDPHTPKLNLSYPVGGYFDTMSIFMENASEPSRFFSLDPKGHEKKTGGLYLVGYTRGYYGQTNDLPQRMWAFAKKNSLLFNGPVYNIYLFDELTTMNHDDYLLQVSASVVETRRIPSRRPHVRH